ncbi:MAG TPA: Nif3-like dinuclear metal center hexameric protein [Bacteroidales bacterium]|nr:Nif3-like dinuclear metal center hexameric protein [Bacteroidales bacterium]
MKLKELCSFLDSQVPLSFQESYDNSGLQTGNPDLEISKALLALDITEKVVDEAISSGCNLIITHHPLIFEGVKKITGRNSTERIIVKCIKNDIAVYSAHTNLDIMNSSVSSVLAGKLGLTGISPLVPLENKLLKLVTFIPETHLEKVRNAIFEAGAGVIGNYDNCGFVSSGTGSFRGNDGSNPFAGKKGELHFEREVRFETILFIHNKDQVIKALLESHPYEEVAYDLYMLENNNTQHGTGCTGIYDDPCSGSEFLHRVAEVTGNRHLRYSGDIGRTVRKVAICGGSGSQFIRKALLSGADAYVTGDIKYHSFFDGEDRILLIDAGHSETEKYATEILKELILKKFPKFALRFSDINTNPINYL